MISDSSSYSKPHLGALTKSPVQTIFLFCVFVIGTFWNDQGFYFFASVVAIVESDDMTMEEYKDLSCEEPVMNREEPLGSVNGQSETEDKENNNGTDQTQAARYEDNKYLFCVFVRLPQSNV